MLSKDRTNWRLGNQIWTVMTVGRTIEATVRLVIGLVSMVITILLISKILMTTISRMPTMAIRFETPLT